MYGPSMGSLRVLTTGRGTDNPVLKLHGDQGDKWHEAAISTTVSKEERVGKVY